MYDDSATKSLLITALQMALIDGKPLRLTKKRDRYFIFPDLKRINDPAFVPLKNSMLSISGTIPPSKLTWVAALEISIQYVLSKPLLVINPTIIASKTSERTESKLVAPFVKEVTARWYNQKYDGILNSWLKILFGEEKEITISAFTRPIEGVNASFTISKTTAFTKTL
jgi:hypothetical protein